MENAMHAIGKTIKWSVPFLVIASLLMAAVPAFAAPAAVTQDGEGYQWQFSSEDASCEWLAGYIEGYLEFDGEPADDVPVYFTYMGEEYGPYYTWDGFIMTMWSYTPGQGEATVGISAEGWGSTEVSFGGPRECPGNPTPSMTVTCRDVTFSAPGANWVGGYIWTEGDEQEAWEVEGDSILFEELIPGATYYYYWWWWAEEGGGGFVEGFFTVPESCPEVPYYPCIQVAYGDTLEGLASEMLGNRYAAYTGGVVACTSANGDWGENCRALDPFASNYAEVAPRPGEYVCPAPAPDTGE